MVEALSPTFASGAGRENTPRTRPQQYTHSTRTPTGQVPSPTRNGLALRSTLK